MPGPNIWGSLKIGQAYGRPYPWARNVYYVGDLAPTWIGGSRSDTIAAALGRMVQNDVLYLGPGAHVEGNLVVSVPCTIIGAGNRGACFIEPSVTTENGLSIEADDVTLINVGVANGSAADYALSVGAASVSPDRFRAEACKFEGTGVALRLYGAGDVLIDDCECAYAATAIQFRANLIGFNTQIYIRNSRLRDYADAGFGEFANAQQVNGLLAEDNKFETAEDGTAGTDDILLQHAANTGLLTGNRFSRATNGSGFITIGAGIIYNPNGTEAGWSTARPA